MPYPQVYLAIDNCFAYKRWTQPKEWCAVIADLGISYIEASADTELDPLFMGNEYLEKWIDDTCKAQEDTGVKVVNLYSGHGTYTTLGLTHTDLGVRRRFVESWFKPMIKTAAALDAGLGFFAHAFPHGVLQNPVLYRKYIDILIDGLTELNRFAGEAGCSSLGLEQMYAPHLYPWTREQTRELINTVTKKSGRSFYFTEDLGHHRKIFEKPDKDALKEKHRQGLWLGSDRAFALSEKGDLEGLVAEIEKTPYLFSRPGDDNCYQWLAELGAYSPIIHLQQTDGNRSSHLPFTAVNNEWGIIDGPKVLKALKASFDSDFSEVPEKIHTVYLTLEIFTETASIMPSILNDIKASVAYWRCWVPEDGMKLDELVSRLL